MTAHIGEIERQEGDLATHRLEQAHLLEGRIASGIAVEMRILVVDEQNAAGDAPVLDEIDLLAQRAVAGKQCAPPGLELRALIS